MLRKTAISLSVVLTLMCAAPAHAIGDLIDVQVIDRTTGETLTPILYKGEWWIAGRPGARYTVTLANRYAQRTLNVMSVDGVNVISGETAAWNQRGYVLDPYMNMQVTGWRKSMDQVNAFEFTTLANSYATRTGRPANLGVIGVAVFNERPEPIAQGRVGRSAHADSPSTRAAPASTPAPVELARDEAEADSSAQSSAQSSARMSNSKKAESSLLGSLVGERRERIGTGYGAVENSSIVNVRFDRQQSTPNEIVTIHYDRRENLIAMGIIPSPPLPPVAVNPFPNSSGFVPEPPRHR